jgi:hypothetical protein
MSKSARKNFKRRESKKQETDASTVPGLGEGGLLPKPASAHLGAKQSNTSSDPSPVQAPLDRVRLVAKTAGEAKVRLSRAFVASLNDEGDHARVKVKLSKGLEKVLGRASCFEDEILALLVDAGAVSAVGAVPGSTPPGTSAVTGKGNAELPQGNKWQRAAALARGLKDPWEKFQLPKERVSQF